jgi:hypothetical protein
MVPRTRRAGIRELWHYPAAFLPYDRARARASVGRSRSRDRMMLARGWKGEKEMTRVHRPSEFLSLGKNDGSRMNLDRITLAPL